MARILIIDDDAAFLATLQATLRSLGHTVIAVDNGADGLLRLNEGGIELAFVDFRMPGMDGIQVLRARADDPRARQVPLVMLTAYASSGNTIEAMTLGAFDHLVKPVGRADIVEVVERALASRADADADAAASGPPDDDDGLVGHSPAMRTVHKRIGLAAASDLPVLITGETGTGKELVARALHRASARANAAFVAVNCAAIPLELMESELFGHRKGAFSGATSDRIGLIREADGGTLFLDEIGDMPLPMQAKLLRFLQEGEVTPLGGRGAQKVDVRVLAATHRDLAAWVAAGQFRSDLRYRLNVVPIELPPLRERGQDIVLLAQYFCAAAKARRVRCRRTRKRGCWPTRGPVTCASYVTSCNVASCWCAATASLPRIWTTRSSTMPSSPRLQRHRKAPCPRRWRGWKGR